MERLEIIPASRIAAMHAVPGSKSYTNRALTIAALARGASTLSGALESDDTHVAREALKHLGIIVEQDGSTFVVHGHQERFSDPQQPLFLGHSGTTTPFLTALLTLAGFPRTITGTTRMQERPIADLLDALNQLGAEATSVRGNGCPPVHIKAQRLRWGEATISGAISSQFLSAILMAAPYAEQDVTLIVRDTLVSVLHVDFTSHILDR